jgi:hypothetical protein
MVTQFFIQIRIVYEAGLRLSRYIWLHGFSVRRIRVTFAWFSAGDA